MSLGQVLTQLHEQVELNLDGFKNIQEVAEPTVAAGFKILQNQAYFLDQLFVVIYYRLVLLYLLDKEFVELEGG